MEVCGVDQVGWEDHDLDKDTAAHILHDLEEERKHLSSGKRTIRTDERIQIIRSDLI